MVRPDLRLCTRVANVICLAGAAAAIAAFAGLFRRYAVEFPAADDFSQLLAVPQYFYAQATKWAALRYLAELSIDHRILTLRLAAVAQARLFGHMSFTGLMVLGTCLLASVALLLARMTPRAYRVPVVATATALFVSPINHEAHFWATGALQHFGVLAYALSGLYCLSRPQPAARMLAVVLIAAAVFTSANGLAALMVAAPMLLLLGRRREAALWLMAAMVLLPLYFVGKPPAGAGDGPLAAILHPWQLVRFSVLALGSSGVVSIASALLGAALLATWMGLIVFRARVIPPPLLAWSAFLVASALTIAVGRVEFGDEGALISRYRIYSEALCLVTIVALLHVMPRRSATVLAYVGTATAFGGFALAFHMMIPTIAYNSIKLQASRSHYFATGHGIYDTWPPQDFGDFVLERARLLGYYTVRNGEVTPVTLAGPAPSEVAATAPVWVHRITVTPHAITLHGLAPPNALHAFLWLDDGVQRHRAPLHRLSYAADAAGWSPVWATVVLTANAGTYRIGYGIEDSGHDEIVYWTDRTVDHWTPKF